MNNEQNNSPMLPPVLQCMCRECGALCLPIGWEDRGGLCPRCVSGQRPALRVTFLNGRELVGEKALRDAIAAHARARDPIAAAIERGWHDWARDVGGDS